MAIEREMGAQQDIPLTPDVSSVGSVSYLPQEASDQRVRSIYPEVIENVDQLTALVDCAIAYPLTDARSRITMRTFVTQGAVRSFARNHVSQPERLGLIEGIIPLHATLHELSDCAIVYIGNNLPSRRSDHTTVNEQIRTAEAIFSIGERDFPTVQPETVSVRAIGVDERADPRLCRDFLTLYGAFGWNEQQVDAFLSNPETIVVGAFIDERLVSSGSAERAQLQLSRPCSSRLPPFVMYEITEAVTHESLRGMGLYTAVAFELRRTLQDTDTHLVYGESNLHAPAVLRVAHKMGRASSLQSLAEFGFPPNVLNQHVRISGGSTDSRPETEKNNLLPTYMPRQALLFP